MFAATGNFDPSVWYSIAPDGIVTVTCGKADMGEHIASTMAQIICEELGASWKGMRFQLASNDPKFNDRVLGAQLTGGSWSTMMNFDAISRAGAAGRIALTEYTTNINIHAPLEPMNATAQLQGDRIQLQQVLLNLVRNGIEAMSTISDRPRVLRIRSEPTENGEALVAVEDTGVGLDPASADRIFDPLFTTKLDGMGMGLSICRSIVEAIAGDYGRRRP